MKCKVSFTGCKADWEPKKKPVIWNFVLMGNIMALQCSDDSFIFKLNLFFYKLFLKQTLLTLSNYTATASFF